MNRTLWVLGIIAMGYGVFGMFYYYPSAEYIDKPFPMEHHTQITPNVDGNGYRAWSFADPITSVKADPYWLAWSVSFYFGVMLIVIFSTKNIFQKLKNTDTKHQKN